MKFVIKGEHKPHVVQLASNWEPLNSSETFERHAGAIKNIRSVIMNMNPMDNTRFKVYDIHKQETFFFIVVAHVPQPLIEEHERKAFTTKEKRRFTNV